MTIPWFSISALFISTVALLFSAKTYRRKSGVFVRGNFSIASNRDCNDKYVASVILENLKDRAVTVFAIYLRIGYNYYIEIEDF